ncbi:Predicted phosphodiesterase [Streptomyces sp. 1222.5]|nr:putative phosphodiesterase [Streptomyces sp. 5112.2]SEC41055.1 Predicted phosphodiesterase [Streptomyces sp. 1222.5]
MREEYGRLAVLSDVHGVLPALEAVLAEPEVAAADRIVLTGDITAGPQPGAVLDLLRAQGERVLWVGGNADRELVEYRRGERTEIPDPIGPFAARELTGEQVDFLAALPRTLTLRVRGLGTVLFCHATPRDDEEVVLVDSRPARWAEVLTGLDADIGTVVCGHTHMPYVRLAHGRLVVNPGSVAVRPAGRPLVPPRARHRPARHAVRHTGGRGPAGPGVRLPGHRRVGRLLPARARDRHGGAGGLGAEGRQGRFVGWDDRDLPGDP